MKKLFILLLLSLVVVTGNFYRAGAQANLDSLMPVRGICIDLPRPASLDSFLLFIDKGLAPQKINLLIVAVEYNYKFTSHPELADSGALSKEQVKKIVAVCRKNHIRLIPQLDLLGHQGWENKPNMLLKKYPQFDETPWVANPVKYEWPNADNLYCRSYCPLYPGLHKILFDVIDEMCDVFESTAFHGGMDEVFYLGEAKCPRCGGKDKSVLFADEVKLLHDHLALKGREYWMWGDRFLDGSTTGLGIWEASGNDTYRSIDLVPKDIVICDWHYERPDKTAVYFAMKGFRVLTCPWRTPSLAIAQVRDMADFREESTPEMKDRFMGMLETTWTHTDTFMRNYWTPKVGNDSTAANTFHVMIDAMNKLH